MEEKIRIIRKGPEVAGLQGKHYPEISYLIPLGNGRYRLEAGMMGALSDGEVITFLDDGKQIEMKKHLN